MNLWQYGSFARYLRSIATIYQWPEGTWYLGDAVNLETLTTMSFLANGLDYIKTFGFALMELEQAELEEVQLKANVPICMNLPRGSVVVWVSAEGQVIKHQGAYVGFRFSKILEHKIEVRDKRMIKSQWPEIVVQSDIKTVPLIPPSLDISQNSSDPLDWELAIEFEEEQPDTQ